MKTLLYIIVLLYFGLSVFAQKNFHRINKIVLDENIQSSFYDKKNGKEYLISVKTKSKSNHNENEKVSLKADGTNSILEISDNERILCINNNQIFSIYDKYPEARQIIKRKIIDGNIETITLDLITFSKSVEYDTVNNLIIVTDLFEGEGSQFEIYNNLLESIASIIPFENGYLEYRFYSTNMKLWLAVQSRDNHIKIVELNALNGSIVRNLIIPFEDVALKDIKVINDQIFIYLKNMALF